jgi:hypothetical protein
MSGLQHKFASLYQVHRWGSDFKAIVQNSPLMSNFSLSQVVILFLDGFWDHRKHNTLGSLVEVVTYLH